MTRNNPRASAQADLPLMAAPSPTLEDLADKARRAFREEVTPAFQAAVTRMTPKVAAPLLECGPTYLADAIAERDRKSVRLEWLVVLLMTAPDGAKHELVTLLNRLAGYKPPERARELTLEEEFRIWRAATERRAPGIVDGIKAEIEAAR